MSDRHPDIYNEFDLEAARKAGQADERERIVKYLEEHKHLRYPNIQVRALLEELNWFMTEGEKND